MLCTVFCAAEQYCYTWFKLDDIVLWFNNILWTTMNRVAYATVGSKTLFNPVFIDLEQIDNFWVYSKFIVQAFWTIKCLSWEVVISYNS